MKSLWIRSLFASLVWGVAVIAVSSILLAVGLSFWSDPLHLLGACALIADFAGGFAAALTATRRIKEKPLVVALLAGAMLALLLALLSLIGDFSGLLPAAGLVFAGALIGGLAAPALGTRRKSKYGRLVKGQ